MTAVSYFWNRMSKYVKSVATHFQFSDKNEDPSQLQVQKK